MGLAGGAPLAEMDAEACPAPALVLLLPTQQLVSGSLLFMRNFTQKFKTKSKACKYLIRPRELLSGSPRVWGNSLYFSHKLSFPRLCRPTVTVPNITGPMQRGRQPALCSQLWAWAVDSCFQALWMLLWGWEPARGPEKSPRPISSCSAQVTLDWSDTET